VLGESTAQERFCACALGQTRPSDQAHWDGAVYADEFVTARIALFGTQVTLGRVMLSFLSLPLFCSASHAQAFGSSPLASLASLASPLASPLASLG
jgi:hypothetical protein